jgi:hypothetical protein
MTDVHYQASKFRLEGTASNQRQVEHAVVKRVVGHPLEQVPVLVIVNWNNGRAKREQLISEFRGVESCRLLRDGFLESLALSLDAVAGPDVLRRRQEQE